MKRKIITIDEEKCNGCAKCVTGCPEGAIQLIKGKARLVGELYCDGLGACIGQCPQGAISIEEREAQAYSETKTMANIIKQGPEVIRAHLHHLKEHDQIEYLKEALEFMKQNNIAVPQEETGHMHGGGGCPGSRMLSMKKKTSEDAAVNVELSSELSQWPIQLHLLNPHAPYFQNADLVIAADCVPFSYPDFHRWFLKGKTLIIFCPKLDQSQDVYVEKLTQIFKDNTIKSITLVHMEVPCCSGVVHLAEQALQNSGKNIIMKEYTISLQGEII